MISTEPDGVVLQGEPDAVEQYVERVRNAAAGWRAPDVGVVLDALDRLGSQVAARRGATADRPISFQFSPDAMRLLDEYGAIPTDEGYFRSFVKDGTAQFAGNLDWTPIVPSTDQALSLQSAAVGLALQASMKQLADAVERVEHQVDVLRDLIDAAEIGRVVDHQRQLRRLVDQIEAGESLSSADWDTVDHLRSEIGASIERVRVYLRLRIEAVEGGWTAASRLRDAQRLRDARVADMLALLATAQLNLVAWNRIKVERVTGNEPEHLDATLAAVRAEVDEQHRLDMQLVADLTELRNTLAGATGFEGLEVGVRGRLQSNVDELTDTIEWFVERRQIDLVAPPPDELPGLRASLGLARDLGLRGASRALDAAKSASRAGRDRVRRSGPSVELAATDPADVDAVDGGVS